MEIKDRIASLVRVRAGDLLPSPKNWRVHTEQQENILRSLVAQLGFVDAVLIRETEEDYQLINGHLRASLDAETNIPALVLDVTQDEADLILASFAPVSAMAEPDATNFSDLIAALEEQSEAVEQMFKDIEERAGTFAVGEADFPEMSDEEKIHEQMTFSGTSEQAETINEALRASNEMGPFAEDGNKNGLALARICEVFLGQS